jgi:hypothetical protein
LASGWVGVEGGVGAWDAAKARVSLGWNGRALGFQPQISYLYYQALRTVGWIVQSVGTSLQKCSAWISNRCVQWKIGTGRPSVWIFSFSRAPGSPTKPTLYPPVSSRLVRARHIAVTMNNACTSALVLGRGVCSIIRSPARQYNNKCVSRTQSTEN